MEFNFSTLSPKDRYKLLVSVVVPRPIALVTSLDFEGRTNAAPFSFFNAFGGEPPIVALGLGSRRAGVDKDTVANIRASREFVVNIVDEAMAVGMNICGIDFPPEEDELAAAGFTPLPGVQVSAPRIAQAPVSLECREHTTLHIGQNRIVIGEVVHMHIRDELIDSENMYVHTEKLHAIGRMHGASWYARSDDLFELERTSYDLFTAGALQSAPPQP
jgi:flavin reductase (DIM6/NTAB) family NADH-FMN oxidoreductase RutF